MTFTNSSVYMLPVVTTEKGKNYNIDNRCTSNFNVDILVQLPAPACNNAIKIKTPALFGSDSMIPVIANGNGKINGYINASNSMIDCDHQATLD